MSLSTLCIDIGSSWVKMAIFREQVCIYFHQRKSILIHQINIEEFIFFVEQIIQDIYNLIKKHTDISSIGFSGIKEGVVLLNDSKDVIWVSSNSLIGNPNYISFFNKSNLCSLFVLQLIKTYSDSYYITSIQGYVAFRLTGVLALTHSEMHGLGISDSNDKIYILQNMNIFSTGDTIGQCLHNDCISVYLAGVDEHVSYLGASIGHSEDLFLSTGTYWTLGFKIIECVSKIQQEALPFFIRYYPKMYPLPQVLSINGYKWGLYLQQVIESQTISSLDTFIPDWAFGKFISYIYNNCGNILNFDISLDAISDDLFDFSNLLLIHSQVTHQFDGLRVYGGGVRNNCYIARALKKLNLKTSFMLDDATLLGCLAVRAIVI